MGNSDCVLTNVPGPANPISFAGHPVKQYLVRFPRFCFTWCQLTAHCLCFATHVQPIIPQSGRGALGICLLTYAGAVGICFLADKGAIQPGLSTLPERFVREFNVLLELAKNAPKGETKKSV